jgi:uncharacterized protein YjiS (DUF1127 family)
MFLWQIAQAHCTVTLRPNATCIHTIEKAMTQAFALTTHPLPPLSRVLLRVTLIAVTWEMRRRTRRDLRKLSDHMLTDIGLDPWSTTREAAKPFWRA